MRNTLILLAGMGILLANVAQAQNKKDEKAPVGSYAPSIEAKEWLNVESEDEIPSLVELRGMVVVVFFWVSWHEGGEILLPYVNMLNNNPQIGQAGGVYTIGVTDASRKVTQPLIEEAKVMFPVAVGSKSAAEYGYRNGFGFVVIDPSGKIAFKGSGKGDLSGMQKAVVDVMTKTPPWKTHPTEAKKVYRLEDQIFDLIRSDKYPKASKKLREAFGVAVLGDPLKSRLFEVADLLELKGYEELAKLDPLLEQHKYDKAVELLRDIIRRYHGFDCYKDAKKRYEQLQKENDRFKEAADRFRGEDAAARLYLEARDKLVARRFGESYDKLQEVVTQYPDTQAAEYAEAMIARMKRNKAFWALIVDHQAEGQCRQDLARAKTLIGQKRYREAEKLLRRILDEYPDTIWAQQAVKELKKLR